MLSPSTDVLVLFDSLINQLCFGVRLDYSALLPLCLLAAKDRQLSILCGGCCTRDKYRLQ